jgi:sugar (pentulose or hexulose) kinase
VLDELGVPAATLPGLVLPGSQLGSVSPDAAEATGIPAGTAVIAGMTDGCAAQVGAGAVAVGSWNSALGTTLVVKGVSAQLLRDPHGVVYSHRAPGGGWLPGGASSTGAGALTHEFGGRDLAGLDRQALRQSPPATIAYPLVSAGERFPFVEPDARGFVLGEPSGDDELYSALLHGVAYVERLCFDYLDLLGADLGGDLYLTGGAAKSALWCQLRADVLGRPVKLPENPEPAIGMAALAAAQDRPLAEVSAEMLRVRETIEPTSGTLGGHDEAYGRLVQELEDRGWLPPPVASHARERTLR